MSAFPSHNLTLFCSVRRRAEAEHEPWKFAGKPAIRCDVMHLLWKCAPLEWSDLMINIDSGMFVFVNGGCAGSSFWKCYEAECGRSVQVTIYFVLILGIAGWWCECVDVNTGEDPKGCRNEPGCEIGRGTLERGVVAKHAQIRLWSSDDIMTAITEVRLKALWPSMFMYALLTLLACPYY